MRPGILMKSPENRWADGLSLASRRRRGRGLDVLVQYKRNRHAALKLMRKLLKKYAFAPARLVTDDLRSYPPAARDLGVERMRERGPWRNNRAENSHRPTRRRERQTVAAIFPLELFASRQFDLVQAILRPSRPQSALPSC